MRRLFYLLTYMVHAPMPDVLKGMSGICRVGQRGDAAGQTEKKRPSPVKERPVSVVIGFAVI